MIIKDMVIKDSGDRKWLTCVSTALMTLLKNAEGNPKKAHLESYLTTVTILICSAPPQAVHVNSVGQTPRKIYQSSMLIPIFIETK